MLILKLAFLLITGSLGSFYETTVLFHWKQQFLNIFSTFKPLDLYFPILKQVLKSELVNYLKNSRNSLIFFIAMSMCMLSKEFQNQFHCVSVCVREEQFPHTSKQFWDIIWDSHNSTQFWHYWPAHRIRFPGEEPSPIRLPPPCYPYCSHTYKMPTASGSCRLSTDRL